MKVYFAASSAGIPKYKANYLLIMNTIRSLGLELIDNHFTSRIEGRRLYKNAVEAVQGEIRCLSQSDFVIAEVEVPSYGVGVGISQAVTQRKPVLCLYPLSADPSKVSDVFAGYYYDQVRLEYYDENNIKGIIQNNIALFGGKGLFKFNFLISPQINDFLELGSRQTGKSKSEFLREEIIRNIIEKEPTYKKKQRKTREMVILVNKTGKSLKKYVPRHQAHVGQGLLHKAFVCLVVDKNGKVLLHKRKHWLWDGHWDVTAISHPLYINGREETYKEAAKKALKREMGVRGVNPIKLGSFVYFAKHPGDGSCENEFCVIMFGRYDGNVSPNPEDVYEYKWMDFQEFVKDAKTRPEVYTPWSVLMVETLEKSGKLDKLAAK